MILTILNRVWIHFRSLSILILFLHTTLSIAGNYEAELRHYISNYHQNQSETSNDLLDIAFIKFIYSSSPEVYKRFQEFKADEGENVIFDLSNSNINPVILSLTLEYLAIRFPQLYGLDLSGNGLQTLPESMSLLTHLQKLSVKNNGLREFPETILKLTHLSWLSMAENYLTRIPDTISNLINLRKLYLANNNLISLSPSISILPQLKTIDIRNNQLQYLPSILLQLEKLNILGLKSNPWLNKEQGLKISFEKASSLKHLCLLNISQKTSTTPTTLIPELKEEFATVPSGMSRQKILIFWQTIRGKSVPFGKSFQINSMCSRITENPQIQEFFLFFQ